jgi:hypothetical protein
MCGLETAKLALDAIYGPGTESHAWDIDTTLETAIHAAHGNENLEHVHLGPEEGDFTKACHSDAAMQFSIADDRTPGIRYQAPIDDRTSHFDRVDARETL